MFRRWGMTWRCGLYRWRPLAWFSVGIGYSQSFEVFRTDSGQWLVRIDVFLFWFCGWRRAWRSITFPVRRRLYGHFS